MLSEAYLNQAIIDNLQDAIVVAFDTDLRFVFVGGGGPVQANRSREDLLGKRASEAFSPHAAKHVIPLLHRALGGETIQIQYLATDQVHYYDLHISPIYDADNQITGGIYVAQNITANVQAQRLLQESELRYRLIVEDQTEMICRLDPEQRFVFANGTFCAFFQTDYRQIVGRSLTEALPLEIYPSLQQLLKGLSISHPLVKDEFKARTRTGKRCWFIWTCRAIYSTNALIGYQIVAYDVTALKKAQRAERRHHTTADALREIAATLHQSLDLDSVLDCIMENIERVVAYRFANIMLIEGELATVRRSRGYRSSETVQLNAMRIPIQEVPALQLMWQKQSAIVISDTYDVGRVCATPSEFSRVRSYVGAPIISNGNVIGFLNLESDQANDFEKKHGKRLRAFTEHAALAIYNAQIAKKLQQMAVLEERQRIASDLHDTVTQTLFSINMIADALPHLWTRSPAQVPEQLATIRQQTQIVLSEMRTMLFELRPDTLVGVKLHTLVEQLVKMLTSRTQIAVSFEWAGEDHFAINETHKIGFYRIIQETINNIIKHSQATTVEIVGKLSNDGALLVIRDNGRGFDVMETHSGLGLRVMRERAEAIGIHLSIASNIGQGTQIVLSNYESRISHDQDFDR
jgi:PAS domain S-box-containing protein